MAWRHFSHTLTHINVRYAIIFIAHARLIYSVLFSVYQNSRLDFSYQFQLQFTLRHVLKTKTTTTFNATVSWKKSYKFDLFSHLTLFEMYWMNPFCCLLIMISDSIEFSPWTGRTFLFAYLSLHFFDDKQTQTQDGKLKLTKTTKFQATLNVADYIYIINNSSSFLYFTCVSLTFRSLAFNSSFFSSSVLNYTQFFCIHCTNETEKNKTIVFRTELVLIIIILIIIFLFVVSCGVGIDSHTNSHL